MLTNNIIVHNKIFIVFSGIVNQNRLFLISDELPVSLYLHQLSKDPLSPDSTFAICPSHGLEFAIGCLYRCKA